MQWIEPKQQFKVLEITHQNPAHKASQQKYYYPIREWQSAGLNKRSWIYIGNGVKIPGKIIINQQPIGKLTPLDETGLFKFMVKHSLKL